MTRTYHMMLCFGILAVLFIPAFGSPMNAEGTTDDKRAFDKKAYLTSVDNWYSWMNSAWTDQDASFASIRSDIDSHLTAGTDVKQLDLAYTQNAATHLNDPKAMFGYYYLKLYEARVEADQTGKVSEKTHRLFSNLGYGIQFGRVKFPHTYNFARLVFLCAMFDSFDRELIPLGKRLLAHDPSDYQVKYTLTGLLAGSKSQPDIDLAMGYAHELTNEYQHPGVQYLLGYLYEKRWRQTHSKADANDATGEYRQYLNSAPPGADYYRRNAENSITEMNNS